MLTRTASNLFRSVGKLHADEGGNESLQTILILAIGAMVMIGLHHIWQTEIMGQVIGKLKTMLGLDFTKAAEAATSAAGNN